MKKIVAISFYYFRLQLKRCRPTGVNLLLQIVVLLLVMMAAMPAFSQTSHWALKAGGATVDEATDISMDAAGNAYTTGYFTGNASFGTQSLAQQR